jgi:hypothetical protein
MVLISPLLEDGWKISIQAVSLIWIYRSNFLSELHFLRLQFIFMRAYEDFHVVLSFWRCIA